MPTVVVQDWTQLSPFNVKSAGGLLDSGARPWPQGVNVIEGRIDCTPFSGGAATRFNDTSKIIDWSVQWDFGDGDGFHVRTVAGEGSPDGVWGKAQLPYPVEQLDFSNDPEGRVPVQYRATAVPRTSLRFGVSYRFLLKTPD